MKFTMKDSTIYADGKPMFALARAVWGDDPGIPTWAELDAARDALAAQLATTTKLLEMVKALLNTCELSLDDMEEHTRDTIDKAWALIAEAEGSATP